MNDRWDIMADAQFTGWDKIKDLTFIRTNGERPCSPETYTLG